MKYLLNLGYLVLQRDTWIDLHPVILICKILCPANQEIEEVDTDEHYEPKHNVGIIDVTLKREI